MFRSRNRQEAGAQRSWQEAGAQRSWQLNEAQNTMTSDDGIMVELPEAARRKPQADDGVVEADIVAVYEMRVRVSGWRVTELHRRALSAARSAFGRTYHLSVMEPFEFWPDAVIFSEPRTFLPENSADGDGKCYPLIATVTVQAWKKARR